MAVSGTTTDRGEQDTWTHRTPTTLDSGIKAFQREMEALAPPDDEHERSNGSS